MNPNAEQWPANDPRPASYGQAQEQVRPLAEPATQYPQPPQPGQPQAGQPQAGQPQPYTQVQPYAQGQPYAQAQPYGAAQAGYPAQQVVAAKNPALGVLLSFFIPGLGSMVNGAVGRGVLILALYAVGWLLSLFLVGIPLLIGAWIWGLVDGYTSAQRWNRQYGIVS
jgi:TM2 domain-containing membrane protein YozV